MQIGNNANISSSAGTGTGVGYRGSPESKGDDQEEAKTLPEATA